MKFSGVTVLAWLLNRRRLVKLTKIDQFIMAFGGLRGGIAFCLALSLEEELVPEKRLFITATIIIVFFTVFIQVRKIQDVSKFPSLTRFLKETSRCHFTKHLKPKGFVSSIQAV